MSTIIACTAAFAVIFIYLIITLARLRNKRSLNRMTSKWEQ